MAKHLYHFFTPDAVKRSMRCDWSSKDGGVTSREAEAALDALTTNSHFKFDTKKKVAVETKKNGDEAVLPPAQYQPGESDSVPTFRAPGPLVRRTLASSSQKSKESGGNSTIDTEGDSQKKKRDTASSSVKQTVTVHIG